MPEKSDKLFSLIHSLTKAEKRFFRLHASSSGKPEKKKYLLLFDIFSNINSFDEKSILKRAEQKGIAKQHFINEKNYLYAQILESLNIQHAQTTAKAKVRSYLSTSEILLGKGLLNQAIHYSDKALKTAKEFYLSALIPDIILTRRKMGLTWNSNEWDMNQKDMSHTINYLNNYEIADRNYRKTISLLYSRGKIRNQAELRELEELIPSSPFKDEDDLDFKVKIRIWQKEAAIHYLKNETVLENDAIRNIIQIMDKHQNYKAENPFDYISFYSHLLRTTKQLDRNRYKEEFQKFLRIPESIKYNKKRIQARTFSLAYSTETVRLLEEGLFQEGIQLKPTIEKLNKDYGNLIQRGTKMAFEYKNAYFHYGAGEHTMALKHINNVINDFNYKERPDIYRFARIFSIIIHFELGNRALVPYLLRSVINFLKNRDLLYEAEQIILECIRRLPRTRTNDELKTLLIEYRGLLMNLFQRKPSEIVAMEYFDFITWADSKIHNYPFKEMKERNLSRGVLPIQHIKQ